MCGAMAEDPVALPLLVGLGLDRISIAPTAIPLAKAVVRAFRFKDVQRLVQGLLELGTPEEVAAEATAFAGRTFPQLLEGRAGAG
jgi:phosphoenolpyruvate-protein kinase (PTS system EI component)